MTLRTTLRNLPFVMTTDAIRSALSGIPPGHLRVRVALDLSGKRQVKVAKRIGISQSTLSNIVNGNRPISDDERKPIAKALGLDESDLFGEAA